MAKRTLMERCKQIQFLLVDVDGVLTDGRITYSDRGDEIKTFHVRDGGAFKVWRLAGKSLGILSGRRSEIVMRRGLELGASVILQGIEDKRVAYEDLLAERNLNADEVCYLGDDLIDVPVLRRCGLAATPADACAEAQASAHYVAQAVGGAGVVREVIELILKTQNLWEDLVKQLIGDPLPAGA